MSPMAYVPVRVAHHAAEGRSLFKADTLTEAVLDDLREHGYAVLDFCGVRHAELHPALVLCLAVREAFPDIHHGSRDGGLGTMTPNPALFFSAADREVQAVFDDAWDRAAAWFEGHLVAGTPCYRCFGRGKVVAGHENHGCGFTDTTYRKCDVCDGVGILA